jgi:hypothetical protein
VHLLLRPQRDDVPEKALREWHHGAESGTNDMPALRTNLSKRGVVSYAFTAPAQFPGHLLLGHIFELPPDQLGDGQRVDHLPGEAI